ncbi:hypothetical protein B0H67DRAFT_639924 [Lasiosphaeris hirsuta]|uniref:Conidiation-specific protein 8 n=1 Tax=Lasiosphaeris hirsuta TaxID=260670 RepID=A0AA40BC59_9PEZI|nr:hypothetical protein B0H67DRAFT_639924 [Lasiosphaeris hirsuta]
MADTSDTAFRNERSGSTSSANSAGSASTPRRASSIYSPCPLSTPTNKKSPIQASHGLFESLTAQKRSNDPASLARRQSLHEQRPRVGFIGQMWNNWVRGTTK